MDLSDGSDVEEGIGDVDQDAENVLLGSDDEELNYTRTHSGHHDPMGMDENEDKVLETDEEEDVLELALDADEELDEFVDEPLKSNRVAPVKVRMQENIEKPLQSSNSALNKSTIEGSQSQSNTELDDEEDTDTDPKNTRTRFLTERKTEDMNSNPVSVGNPIQILGERKGRVGHPDLRQPKSWGNQRPQGSRQFRGPRPPPNRQSLLGDAPRHQGFRPRFPNANDAPVLQFTERIFTDFNQPISMGQQQQPINTVGTVAPIRNPSLNNAPRHPPPGNRGPNQQGNRQRLYKTTGNLFMENGIRPRIQNSGPRHRNAPPQQWKNRQHPQGGGGMPPEVSGVHPAVIISGNSASPFQGPGGGHPNSQNSGNSPNQGPPPHIANQGPGPHNQSHGPPGPNMGPNAKRPIQGGNMHGPPRHSSPQGPNVRGPHPGLHGPPPGANVHGPPGSHIHNPNMQGPPQGPNPNMHGPPPGSHMHGPPPQGPPGHGQPPHQLGPRVHGPSSNIHSGGPMQGPNIHGPPQPPGPNHRMVRPNNQGQGLPSPHVNQNFGPVPNNFNHGHPRQPFDVHPMAGNQGMPRPPIHGDHQNRPNEIEMGFGQPRPMHGQINVRPPFPPQMPQFGNPPRMPGPGPPVEMGENGPFFHQPPGPNHLPVRIMDQQPPPFWNNPQGPPGNQDPNSWNHSSDHRLRNIVVVQPNNISGDFRNSGPQGERYPGQHPGPGVVNGPPVPHYGSPLYQGYETDIPPGYMDRNQMVGPGYDQQQQDPYYHGESTSYDQYGSEMHTPHSSVPLTDHGRYVGDDSSITRTIVVSNAHEQENFLSNSRREDYSDDYYHSDRPAKKRRPDPDDYNPYLSPGKRLNHRLGPPVRSREREEQREEAVKIILETKKEMGLDDDYIKRLEDQKRLREQILRKKEERRKLTKGGHDSEDGFESGQGHSSQSTVNRPDSERVRNSVYINPKAFKGNLTLLNSNLKKINMNATSKSVEASNERNPAKAPDVPKARTILRIVRNKKGKIISQSKVKIIPNEHQDGPSSSTKTS